MSNVKNQNIRVSLVSDEELAKIDKIKIVKGFALEDADVTGQEASSRSTCMKVHQRYQ